VLRLPGPGNIPHVRPVGHFQPQQEWYLQKPGRMRETPATIDPIGGLVTRHVPVILTRRELVHRHLEEHPGLTAFEIGRALHIPASSVCFLLRRMEQDGETDSRTVRSRATGKKRLEWRAT
jgi:hypothetical protein